MNCIFDWIKKAPQNLLPRSGYFFFFMKGFTWIRSKDNALHNRLNIWHLLSSSLLFFHWYTPQLRSKWKHWSFFLIFNKLGSSIGSIEIKFKSKLISFELKSWYGYFFMTLEHYNKRGKGKNTCNETKIHFEIFVTIL